LPRPHPPGTTRNSRQSSVYPERADLLDPARVVHKRCPVIAHSRHHRRPEDAEPACERGDRSRLLAGGTRALTSRPRGQHTAVGKLVRALCPCLDRAVQVRATETALGPDKSHATVERWQVSDEHPEPVLCPRDHTAGRTPRHPADRLDADEQLIAVFGHCHRSESRQSQQRVVEFGTVTHGGGLPLSKLSTATRMARPHAAPVDTYPIAVSCSRAPVH
jgi:hypothetical protein